MAGLDITKKNNNETGIIKKLYNPITESYVVSLRNGDKVRVKRKNLIQSELSNIVEIEEPMTIQTLDEKNEDSIKNIVSPKENVKAKSANKVETSPGKSYSRKVAEEELLRLHPDYNDISDNDDFHQWAKKQPKWVQEAIYENNWDVLASARALDLYKKERNINSNKSSTTKNKDKVKSAKKAETSLGKSKARIAAEVEPSEAAKEADNVAVVVEMGDPSTDQE